MSEIALSRYIESIRSELEKSVMLGKDASVQFVTDKLELELEGYVEQTNDAEAGGGFKFWVLSGNIGGKSGQVDRVTQRLKLSLTPVDAKTGDNLRISAKGGERR